MLSKKKSYFEKINCNQQLKHLEKKDIWINYEKPEQSISTILICSDQNLLHILVPSYFFQF